MTDRKIRWGVLSTANIARRRVVPAIQQSRNGLVTAVASRSLAPAQAFAQSLNIPKAYGSYEELLADPEIDAIYNPLPNSMHAEWSIRAAQAGKPTLCEKPLASNAAEAQTMVTAFAERGILFAEAFMYRFHPQTVRLKHLVDSGVIGDLRAIQAAFTFTVADEGNIRLDPALAGGSLMDVGCYCVNIIRHLTGAEPTAVKALANWGASGVDDALAGVMQFENGVLAHFDGGLRSQFNHMTEIRGTRGRILVEESFVMPPEKPMRIRVWEKFGERTDITSEIVIPPANSYTHMAEDFADALLEGRPPLYAPEDAVANMRVIDQLYADARR